MFESTTRSIRSAPTVKGAFCTSSSATIGSSISRPTNSSSGQRRLLLVSQAKLPAGRVDVGSLSFANGRGDALLFEDFDKRPQPLGLGVVKRQFGNGVHRNQIDVRISAAQEPCQFAGLVEAVVASAEDDVLIGDPPSGLLEEL